MPTDGSGSESRGSHYGVHVQQAVEWLAQHLDHAFDVTAWAERAGVTPFCFHHMFQGMVGESATELQARLRLERAAWQVAATHRTLRAIALETGFVSPEAFRSAFRARYGLSPTLFRQRKYPQIELPASGGVHFQLAGTTASFVQPADVPAGPPVRIAQRSAARLAALGRAVQVAEVPAAFAYLTRLVGSSIAGANALSMTKLAIYSDAPDSTAPDGLRAEAAVVVTDAAIVPGELVERRLAAGRIISVDHDGAPEPRGRAWAWLLGAWLPASGLRIGPSPVYEVWADDSGGAPPPACGPTELCAPIED